MTENEEKLEFLKREEIRTMEKDVASLREAEAKAEREKIAKFKTEEKVSTPSTPDVNAKTSGVETTPPAIFPKPLSKTQGSSRKALIRGLLVFSFILISGAIFWVFRSAPKTPPPSTPDVNGETSGVTPAPLSFFDKLPLEQKIGQLLIAGFKGKTLTPELEAFLKKYKPGGVLLLRENIESKEQLKNLISQIQNISLKETGLPLLVAADQEGGVLSRIGFLTEKTGQNKIKSADEAFQIGLRRGQELKELGVNLNLAPVLDTTLPRDFLFNRSFQKDSQAAGLLAKSLILGQKSSGVLTAIKHFPGYSGIVFNPEEKLAEILQIPTVSQFQKAMEANPELIITSNVLYQEIDSALPLAFSTKGIQFLKTVLGSDILIIPDDLAQNSFIIKKYAVKDLVSLPIEAGVDFIMFSGYRIPLEQGLDAFYQAFQEEKISKEKAEKAINRIVQLKNNLSK